jgi:CubicO group peptidase (beta-lactamase class C family)
VLGEIVNKILFVFAALLSFASIADEANSRGVRIQALLNDAVSEGRISAGIAMLASPDEIRWIKTAGKMESGIPMRNDVILPLASVGKLFTATALMMLYEDGIVSLDDPVSKFIPEFSNLSVETKLENGMNSLVPADRPITIFHLLTHTSGLTVSGNEFWTIWDAHVGKTTTTHFARGLAELPLVAQPGSTFEYGQTGAAYEVLGAVIEIASGQTLESFMQANIFDPLGLEDSYFYLPTAKSHRLPEVYRRVDGKLELDRQAGEDFSRSTFFHGGGGVRSAPADILKFARLFLEGGSVDGVRILKPESVAMMMRDQLGEKSPSRWQDVGLSWGFGGAVRYDIEPGNKGELTQYGWVGGGFSKLFVDPRERLVAYIGFPLTPPGDNPLLREFESLIYTDAR